ncbi:glycoside hydrolase family 28 protein [Colletotrichum phormii]|uniref:Glycoside hydrolase family 28 protein n=1 Tax=Colletotrichum phormii TaxID=359342 RepID=A0AAJ0E9P2_9PEZI|nr:glycoside hydrolase family 28 protein [Colletotrichum phormii]KAK1621918.1 glycoside hydrolase family 28 protein [Colletotrichum phormii]
MASESIEIYEAPSGLPLNRDFIVEARPLVESRDDPQQWRSVPAYAVDVANANTTRNAFDRHTVALASFDSSAPTTVRVKYKASAIETVAIRPLSLGITAQVENDTIVFNLDQPRDVMIELNGDKWKALHLLTNQIDKDAPTADSEDIWYFGPGINQGSAYSKVTDGVNLMVPSGKTVYLAGGAFITCRLNFIDVFNSSVKGHGFILGPEGECKNVLVNRYRSFSFAGNGDGVDFFCSSDITIENCFLRNSDDTIALYSHRWDWYGDSKNITIRNCVLLPDIAHAINMGTHGNPTKPETTSHVHISNIDILDHEENQLWYQGCIAINAADENLLHDIHIQDVRVEKITKGQLINIRVMKNAMWTTASGRVVHDVHVKNMSVKLQGSKVVNPSMIMGYNQDRMVKNVTFENLRPKCYMVEDFVPLFVNEHVEGVKFSKSAE